mmetsp:Transcript_146286/g.467386  ORF Transcript_146286/g.467386 Transcript_146286/m.467386 type:complete len:132 (-) Transcript_146286:330-725(-)
MSFGLMRRSVAGALRGALAPQPRVQWNLQARAFADKTGVVKFFNTEKGFGFITSGDEDIFVHYSNIQSEDFRSLAEGEEVEFDVEKDQRSGKLAAVRVTGPGGAGVKGAPRSDGGGGDGGRGGGRGGDRDY